MADVWEKDLAAKSSLTTSDYIRVVGSDNVSYKQLVSDVADKIISSRYLAYGATSIPSSADLDTYRTVGVYVCPSGAVAQSLSNCPTTSAFRLEVKQIINADRYVQILYVNYNIHPTLYWRTYNGAWSSWYAPALQSQFRYVSSGSFNSLQSYGLYICQSLSNAPSTSYSSYALAVMGDTTATKQIAYPTAVSGEAWERHYVNSTWSAWVKMPTRAEVDTLNGKFIKSGWATSVSFACPINGFFMIFCNSGIYQGTNWNDTLSFGLVAGNPTTTLTATRDTAKTTVTITSSATAYIRGILWN